MVINSKNQEDSKNSKKTKKVLKIRQVDEFKIIFYDNETIYICHKNGINLYHTWFLKKNGVYYRHVRYFRRALLELSHPTITHINHLAYRHGIVISAVEKLPDLSNRVIKIIDEEQEEQTYD